MGGATGSGSGRERPWPTSRREPGKLTRELVQTGAQVIAVEPLAEMREQLEAALPGVDALAGTAEELPLEDGSVDAITVAAAMHWFDIDRARARDSSGC